MGKLSIIFLNTLFVIFVTCAPTEDNNLIVTLPKGKVQGATYNTPNNFTYYGFRGIPYGKSPVGELRLELPVPAESWNGVLDATADKKSCITINYLSRPDAESEDCLYINVYTPTLQPTEPLPVMFWIYGGGFTNGCAEKSQYGPDFLVEKNVILVSFNYRVGPLGFISTGDDALPGNLGLKDQNLALKWTRDNIQYFGGDPEKITIFGQSAGGASVGLHLVSKQSAGLFRAAIVESGSAINTWSIDLDPCTTAFLIADGIPGGNYGNDTKALKTFLKGRTVEEIITANGKLSDGVQVWPVLEVESEDAFISESPYVLLESGEFNQVPIVIGVTSEESLYFLRDKTRTAAIALVYDLYPEQLIPTDLFPNDTDKTAAATRIRSIYLNPNDQLTTNLPAVVEYYSDNFFVRAVMKHAELTSNFMPVYLYQFAYYGRPIAIPFMDGIEKAGHAAELPFLFNFIGLSETTDPADVLTQERIVTLWSNFAKYLNPTPNETELFSNIIWPKLDSESAYYLNINTTLEIRDHLKKQSYNTWNDVFQTYGKKPYITY